jgi:hypothetical protein
LNGGRVPAVSRPDFTGNLSATGIM